MYIHLHTVTHPNNKGQPPAVGPACSYTESVARLNKKKSLDRHACHREEFEAL